MRISARPERPLLRRQSTAAANTSSAAPAPVPAPLSKAERWLSAELRAPTRDLFPPYVAPRFPHMSEMDFPELRSAKLRSPELRAAKSRSSRGEPTRVWSVSHVGNSLEGEGGGEEGGGG